MAAKYNAWHALETCTVDIKYSPPSNHDNKPFRCASRIPGNMVLSSLPLIHTYFVFMCAG